MGFPGKTAYASSKAAILGFTNSLYTELYESNVSLSLVIPPAIKTGIILRGKHINDDKMRLESEYLEKNGMTAERVAQDIMLQLKKDKYRIVIGSKTYFIEKISRIFPRFILRMIIWNKKKFDFIPLIF
jgi:short-subunit dehydrogenase